MATTEGKISDVQLMIDTDKELNYQQIRTLGIGMSQVHKILLVHLTVRKFYTRWIPYDLVETKKLHRAKGCREIMQRFAGGDSNAVYDIVTGDESCIYSYDPNTKRQYMQWLLPLEELPTKAKRGRSVE